MDGYLNVFGRRIADMIKITIQERKTNGIGVLMLDFSDKDNLECGYLPINHPHFPEDVKRDYGRRIESVPNSIGFFFLFDKIDNTMVEVDLDKNSNFHKVEKEQQTKLEEVTCKHSEGTSDFKEQVN
tara:strand:+ start:64 stop:444 length:381 start_codon:yes stop_codon:yes gene_type:complete